ncbi:hypothetical protein [Tautonia rosea]|uniref:hypothetical protein n=1 Tax=Tautonia rosea TaxID=2728037 RepID=UPI0014747031|nr:hypothetical protein [Tautonia rosea]
MTIKVDLRLIWGYISELVLASMAYGMLRILFAGEDLIAFTVSTASEWNDLTGILFSAALAIWITFVNIRAMPFGEYLHRVGAEKQITAAFVCAMAVFFCATVTLTACTAISRPEPAHAALFLLIYSLVNAYTLVRNSTLLIKLYGKFNRLSKAKVSSDGVGKPIQVLPHSTRTES